MRYYKYSNRYWELEIKQKPGQNNSLGDSSEDESKEYSDLEAFNQEIESLERNQVIDNSEFAVRAFSITGGKTLAAFFIKELPDSFIIAYPSLVVGEGSGKVRVDIATPTPLVRLYKSSVTLTYIPKALHIMYYLKGVFEHLPTLPGYFDESRLTAIVRLTTLLQDVFQGMEEGLAEEEGAVPSNMIRSRRVTTSAQTSDQVAEEDLEDRIFYSPPQQTSRWRH